MKIKLFIGLLSTILLLTSCINITIPETAEQASEQEISTSHAEVEITSTTTLEETTVLDDNELPLANFTSQSTNENVTTTSISSGRATGSVPDVIGSPLHYAITYLNSAGFGTTVHIPSNLAGQEDNLYVIFMTPEAGTNKVETVILFADTLERANAVSRSELGRLSSSSFSIAKDTSVLISMIGGDELIHAYLKDEDDNYYQININDRGFGYVVSLPASKYDIYLTTELGLWLFTTVIDVETEEILFDDEVFAYSPYDR